MVGYATRRLGQAVAVVILVTMATAALTDLIPGSPAALILGDTSQPEAVAALNAQYGWDRPFFIRYWDWLLAALHGNLGDSIQSGQAVTGLLAERIPITLEIAVLSLAVSLVLAIVLALVCAARPDGILDRALTALASASIAIPSFVGCVVFAQLLSARAGWFPTFGWTPVSDSLTDNLLHAALPVIVIATHVAALFLRVLRADVVGMLGEDYVFAARARGLPESFILMRHVLRPASLSLLTLAGLVFGYLIGGSIIVEVFFAIPGLGGLVSQAVAGKDLPVVQGVVVVVAVVYLIVNALVDIGIMLLDPRARRS
jgi:peptide/nickel transport system permease protein